MWIIMSVLALICIIAVTIDISVGTILSIIYLVVLNTNVETSYEVTDKSVIKHECIFGSCISSKSTISVSP